MVDDLDAEQQAAVLHRVIIFKCATRSLNHEQKDAVSTTLVSAHGHFLGGFGIGRSDLVVQLPYTVDFPAVGKHYGAHVVSQRDDAASKDAIS